MMDPHNGNTTLFYYAGGNGPHSGGGVEHGRRNDIGLATGPTNGLMTLDPRPGADARLVVSRPLDMSTIAHTVSVLMGHWEGEGVDQVVELTLRDAVTARVVATANVAVRQGRDNVDPTRGGDLHGSCDQHSGCRYTAEWVFATPRDSQSVRRVVLHVRAHGLPLTGVEL